MSSRDIIFLVFFFASLPICFFRPFFGILMWTVVAFVNPQSFTWSVMYDYAWGVLVAIPTLAGSLLFSRNWRFVFSRNTFLILILWVWFTITTVNNTHQAMFAHFAVDTWHRWAMVSKMLLMILLTIGIVNTWERFRWLLLVIAASFGILVAKAVPFMILTGGTFRLYGPQGSMIGDNNDFGLALNMTLPIFFFMARIETDRRIKRILGFLFVATIPAVFFTYSRGALIGLAVVLVFIVMKSDHKMALVPLVLVAALFAIFLTPEKWQHRMDFRREGALVDGSALSRINSWTYSWNLATDYPLMGGGFEAFTPPLYTRYAPDPTDVHGPHSIYFGVLAEHGFVGLFLYMLLVGSCFATLHATRRQALRWGDKRTADYAAMLQCSLLGFLAAGSFLGRAYFDYYFTIVACTILLRRLRLLDAARMAAAQPDSEEQTAVTGSSLLPAAG